MSGPKFAWSEKAHQLIRDRDPFDKEIFLLSLKETHPISNILRRCAVLDFADFTNSKNIKLVFSFSTNNSFLILVRPTEVEEQDVFLCSYMFDEAKQTLHPLQNGIP